SYLCNGNPTTGPVTIGFELRNSTNVTFNGDIFANSESAFEVLGVAGGLTITDWQTQAAINLITQNITATNNTFVNGASQSLFYDSSLGGSDWTQFASSFASDYNNWWN